MTYKRDLQWLKRNSKYLNLSAIAKGIKLSVRVIHGVVKDQSDGHGTPFKVPAKYHAALKQLIKEIKK